MLQTQIHISKKSCRNVIQTSRHAKNLSCNIQATKFGVARCLYVKHHDLSRRKLRKVDWSKLIKSIETSSGEPTEQHMSIVKAMATAPPNKRPWRNSGTLTHTTWEDMRKKHIFCTKFHWNRDVGGKKEDARILPNIACGLCHQKGQSLRELF